jgi:hypothetical protein
MQLEFAFESGGGTRIGGYARARRHPAYHFFDHCSVKDTLAQREQSVDGAVRSEAARKFFRASPDQ